MYLHTYIQDSVFIFEAPLFTSPSCEGGGNYQLLVCSWYVNLIAGLLFLNFDLPFQFSAVHHHSAVKSLLIEQSARLTKLPMQQMQTVLRDTSSTVAREGSLYPLKNGVLLVWGWEQQAMGSQRRSKGSFTQHVH